MLDEGILRTAEWMRKTCFCISHAKRNDQTFPSRPQKMPYKQVWMYWTQNMLVQGKWVKSFEHQLMITRYKTLCAGEQWHQTKSSLIAAGIGHGDEVICRRTPLQLLPMLLSSPVLHLFC